MIESIDQASSRTEPSNSRPILAVVPSIGAPGVENVLQLLKHLDDVPLVRSTIASNSQRLTGELTKRAIAHVSDGNNGGFGDSIRKAAQAFPEWSWLLIVNDDISLDVEQFSAAVEEALSSCTEELKIIYFDVDRLRPLPKATDVFLQVSLLGKFLPEVTRGTSIDESQSYRSFSCVAVSRALYDSLDGFDMSLPFTYEDADFVRRAQAIGATQETVLASGVVHSHSVSSGKYIRQVLPVATFSAARYLDKLEKDRQGANTSLVLIALFLRIFGIPFSRAPKFEHFLAIFESARAVVRRMEEVPQLPDYREI